MKQLLIIIDKGPSIGHRCGTIIGEGLRAAVGLAGMDIETTVVLVGDAVFTILKEQSLGGTGMKDLDQFMKDAEEFGLKVQVHLESAQKRGIPADLLARFETLSKERLSQLVHEVNATITF